MDIRWIIYAVDIDDEKLTAWFPLGFQVFVGFCKPETLKSPLVLASQHTPVSAAASGGHGWQGFPDSPTLAHMMSRMESSAGQGVEQLWLVLPHHDVRLGMRQAAWRVQPVSTVALCRLAILVNIITLKTNLQQLNLI